MKHHLIIAVASVLLAAALPAAAAPLGLTTISAPDITSGFIDVSYNASSETFLASGFALTLDDDGVGASDNIDPAGSFNITATIDNAGVLSSGSLTIDGSVLGFGPSLLIGSLTDFGFLDGGGDLFEFLFTIDGGDLATLYGDVGPVVGVILDANGSTFTGSFATDFDNNFGSPGLGQGVSDAAPIPEPATLFLVLIAGALIRRKR